MTNRPFNKAAVADVLLRAGLSEQQLETIVQRPGLAGSVARLIQNLVPPSSAEVVLYTIYDPPTTVLYQSMEHSFAEFKQRPLLDLGKPLSQVACLGTLADLLAHSANELLRIAEVGPATLRRIQRRLLAFDLQLSTHAPHEPGFVRFKLHSPIRRASDKYRWVRFDHALAKPVGQLPWPDEVSLSILSDCKVITVSDLLARAGTEHFEDDLAEAIKHHRELGKIMGDADALLECHLKQIDALVGEIHAQAPRP